MSSDSNPPKKRGSIIIIGGVARWTHRILNDFCDYDIRIYTSAPNEHAIRNASVIWTQANATKHKHFKPVIQLARKYKIPIHYFSSTGHNRCHEEFAAYLTAM